MKNNENIHESFIRDIVDMISDGKEAFKNFKDGMRSDRNAFNYRSIAQASSNLTLVFPVLSTRNISIENAAMISKAVERKAVIMLQMLFSAINISDAKSALEHIRKFHTNINFGENDITIDDFMTAMDRIPANENCGIQITDKEMYNILKEDMKRLAASPVLSDNISENSINDYKLRQTPYGTNIVLEKNIDLGKYDKEEQFRKEEEIKKNKEEENRRRGETHLSNLRRDNVNFFKDQILDSDIKKANELIPTGLIVNFVSTATEGTPIKSDQIVIGVKAKLYPIDSMDIINRIKIKNEDKNGLLNFIRATTREISFWKDFVFAIDRAKIDALSNTRRGSSSKMWKVLERRAIKSKSKRIFNKENTGAAITSLVVSQEEVEYLKKNDNINIEDPKVIRVIMEAYNFMAVCIVDEANEVAKFLFDTGDDMYETLSFRNLERESSDNSYKKVINLLTKMSR